MAEGVGFEPTRACALPVFKTGAINRSATPPGVALDCSGAPGGSQTFDRKTATVIERCYEKKSGNQEARNRIAKESRKALE